MHQHVLFLFLAVSSSVNNSAAVDATVTIITPVVHPPIGKNNWPKQKHTQSTRALEVHYLI